MGRIFSVRRLLIATLFCLAFAAAAAAQTSEGMVNLTFQVPAHIELMVSAAQVDVTSWNFSATGEVEGQSYGPSMVGQVSVADHLIVHSNIANWSLSAAFDPTSAFLTGNGKILVKLQHFKGEPASQSGEQLFKSDQALNTFSAQDAKGTSKFSATYFVVAPVGSAVTPGQNYAVQITYTVTAL